ncbi:bifunctional UDP-sugar hydrolase/5'-nucleotidase [Gottfriedia acidiceleris]|uniref:bifunctional metallophosphatase/5'-nucleotidase n=1 Tax=Gottfriedia acidiceleris TaxID=371036 RepID=UPI002F26691B
MKKHFKLLCMVIIATMIIAILQFDSISKVYAENTKKSITILFTHDLHDHLLPFNILENGQIEQAGGYARLQSAINHEIQKDPNLLLVDAGDYSMGTLFQSIYSSDAPELRLLGQLGYDVTTLGNHEFDFRAKGLAESLNSARNSRERLPQVVASNVIYPKDKNGNITPSLMNLKQSMNNYGVKDYTVMEKNGVKIGLFGLMGKEAADDAPMSEVKFADISESAKRVVDKLKQKEKVDLIICLSHSGTNKNKSKSEDEILAKKVPGIDIIISGHSHTKLNEPLKVDKTVIASSGEYGEYLGKINISNTLDTGWKLDHYKLEPINSSLPNDPNISKTINNFKNIVQEKYLNNFGLKFDEILANSSFNFVETSKIGEKHAEDTLGDFITDAYVYAVKKAEGSNYEPIAMAIVPAGIIRGSFVKGNITTADAFNVSSLGIGPDHISGYPLISAYLTGKEIKTICEVDASISPMMPAAQLYMSGISFKFNPNRLIFNKVTDSEFEGNDGSLEKIQENKLYRVVVGLYSAQMLSVVSKKSFGLLSIVPKTKEGKPITDYEGQIITDTLNDHKYEVKEWMAIAEYLQSFQKMGGIPQIPEYYHTTHNRKIVENNHSIFAILSNPNGIAIGAYCILITIGSLLAFIIFMLVTRKKRKHRRDIEIY